MPNGAIPSSKGRVYWIPLSNWIFLDTKLFSSGQPILSSPRLIHQESTRKFLSIHSISTDCCMNDPEGLNTNFYRNGQKIAILMR
jgi:hypothetical protein